MRQFSAALGARTAHSRLAALRGEIELAVRAPGATGAQQAAFAQSDRRESIA